MVNAIRARQQGCAPEDAIDDGNPLLALLDQFAEPDLKPEHYEQLRDEVENQLSHEREWRDGGVVALVRVAALAGSSPGE